MFGFVVLAVCVIWTLSGRKSLKPVLAWGVGVGVGAAVLGDIGIVPFMGALNALGIGSAVGAVFGMTRAFRHGTPAKPGVPADFAATHAHDNLAINSRDQLWVRTEDGREVVLSRYEVRETAHLWHPDRGYKGRNRIEVRTIRLDMPLVVVPFNRHPETVFGAPKNAAEAEEWHARLSAFLQRS